MAEGEKVNLVKAITGPLTGVYWAKLIMYLLGASALFFIGYGVYKAYFKQPPHTTEQNAETINDNYYQPKLIGFGCIRMDKK